MLVIVHPVQVVRFVSVLGSDVSSKEGDTLQEDQLCFKIFSGYCWRHGNIFVFYNILRALPGLLRTVTEVVISRAGGLHVGILCLGSCS